MSEKKRKTAFCFVIIVSYMMILIYNFLTPYMSDDLWYDLGVMRPLSELIKEEVSDYLTWSGRDVGHFILKLSFCVPKPVFNVVNSMVFVIMTVLIYMNIECKKKCDVFIYGLVVIMLWILGVSFDQTILWVSGACNYLWTGTIILGFITVYRSQIYKDDNSLADSEKIPVRKTTIRNILLSFGMFILGLLAGWGNENTSGGAILLVIIFMTDARYICKKANREFKYPIWSISGLIGALLGLLIMVTAPGNKVRGIERLADEEQSGFMAYLGRLLKLNDAVLRNYSIMIVMIVVLLTYLLLKGSKPYDLRYILIYSGICLITTYILILTAIPMDRALFGAGIFLMIACIQAICYIPKEDIYMNVIKYSAVVLTIMWFIPYYISCGADLVRIMRELDERDRYVEEQKASGETDIIIPKLREEWNNKYTYIYHYNDVSEEEEGYGNSVYETYYDLDRVIGIDRDLWTEY